MAKDPDFSKWIKGKYVRFLHKMNMAEDDKSTQQKFKYKVPKLILGMINPNLTINE
jgi:hypothetical protein